MAKYLDPLLEMFQAPLSILPYSLCRFFFCRNGILKKNTNSCNGIIFDAILNDRKGLIFNTLYLIAKRGLGNSVLVREYA